MYPTYRSKGVEAVVVSLDPLATVDDLRGLQEAAGPESGLRFARDPAQTLARAYGVQSLETTVIIDRAGRIAYRDDGSTAAGTYRRELDRVVSGG